jgi:arsenate reductase
MVDNNIKKLIDELKERFDEISENRKELLESFAKYISEKMKENKEINLTFICTHNSRRSHMSQIWAQTAAEYFEIPNVECFSGGTEATAFNPRALRAIRDSGFKVEQLNQSENPVYLVYYANDKDPLKCFSKVYSDDFNPRKNYAAIMTCSDADENCPVVFGAEQRFPIRYDDPKEFDGTDLEEAKYKERFEQIGIEMLFVFNKIKDNLVDDE